MTLSHICLYSQVIFPSCLMYTRLSLHFNHKPSNQNNNFLFNTFIHASHFIYKTHFILKHILYIKYFYFKINFYIKYILF